MHRLSLVLLLLGAVAYADPPSVTGRWSATIDRLGVPEYYTVQLVQRGELITGDFAGDALTGTIKGDAIDFTGKDEQGGFETIKATLKDGVMTGSVDIAFSSDPAHPAHHGFTAVQSTLRRGKPRRHEFTPVAFQRQFSSLIKPVLSVAPGDTIATSTVDAGGTDAKGVLRTRGGNPQTGPFFVEGALPGDTLVVRIVKLRLNRDYAISDDGLVPRSLDGKLAIKMKDTGKDVRWRLDRARGVATSEAASPHLARYTVPLRPMLGCVAVAPGPAGAPPGTGDSGAWGGNMDFNEIVEGSMVYLPVQNPGALLYVGDAHAAQGDGELTGNALETSMDVEITVDVIPGKAPPGPRVETASHAFAMGLDGSLDGAFRAATSNMAGWLADTYQLTPSEIAQVLGTAAEYRVTEVADRDAGMVLAIRKDRLKTLTAK